MPLAPAVTGLVLEVVRGILAEYTERQEEDVVGYILRAHPEWTGADGALVVPREDRALLTRACLHALEEVLKHGHPDAR